MHKNVRLPIAYHVIGHPVRANIEHETTYSQNIKMACEEHIYASLATVHILLDFVDTGIKRLDQNFCMRLKYED